MAASVLSIKPSLFLSSLANSAASSSVCFADVAAGAVPAYGWAAIGSETSPAAPSIESNNPDLIKSFLACIVVSFHVVDSGHKSRRLPVLNQVACQGETQTNSNTCNRSKPEIARIRV